MNAKEIELLFENELGINEVCVYNYDESTKLLNMHFEIDFTPILDKGNDFTNYLFIKSEKDLYMCIFNLVCEKELAYRSIEIVNNDILIGATNDKEKELEELLQIFFDNFFICTKVY